LITQRHLLRHFIFNRNIRDFAMATRAKKSATDQVDPAKRVAWRPAEWRKEFPASHSQLCAWVREGYIASAKVGGMRVILESPQAFLDRHLAK
jgi:hypothetical protein